MGRPKKVLTAVMEGDRRDALIALRNNIAKRIDECESGRDSAALSKRLMEIMNELETLPNPDENDLNPVQRAREMVESRNGPS